MRRLLTISVFLVLAAAAQLNAQRGGGHGSVGGHGGFSGGGSFGGRSAGGRSFAGAHSASSFAPRSFSRGSFSRGSFSRGSSVRGSFARGSSRPQFSSRGLNSRNFNLSRNLRIRSRDFRNNCFGFGFGCGWGYGYDPSWWWNSDSSYDQDQQDQIGLANEMNAQSLDEQRMRESGRSGCLREIRPSLASARTHEPRSRHGAGFSRSAPTGSPELRDRRPDPMEFFSAAHREDSTLATRSCGNDQSERRAWCGFSSARLEPRPVGRSRFSTPDLRSVDNAPLRHTHLPLE